MDSLVISIAREIFVSGTITKNGDPKKIRREFDSMTLYERSSYVAMAQVALQVVMDEAPTRLATQVSTLRTFLDKDVRAWIFSSSHQNCNPATCHHAAERISRLELIDSKLNLF